ncbi:hypothetical protein DFH29DRAFT_914543, partial [Suillus ampliporus]
MLGWQLYRKSTRHALSYSSNLPQPISFRSSEHQSILGSCGQRARASVVVIYGVLSYTLLCELRVHCTCPQCTGLNARLRRNSSSIQRPCNSLELIPSPQFTCAQCECPPMKSIVTEPLIPFPFLECLIHFYMLVLPLPLFDSYDTGVVHSLIQYTLYWLI